MLKDGVEGTVFALEVTSKFITSGFFDFGFFHSALYCRTKLH